METEEARVARVISIALCQYRENRETEFNKQMARMQKAVSASDDYYIAVDKMLRAAEECHAAHDALKAKCRNPCDVWDMDLVAACRKGLGTKADEAYEHAEAAMEDAALAKFHWDAYGEGERPY